MQVEPVGRRTGAQDVPADRGPSYGTDLLEEAQSRDRDRKAGWAR